MATGKLVNKSNSKSIGKGKFVDKKETYPYRINPKRVV